MSAIQRQHLATEQDPERRARRAAAPAPARAAGAGAAGDVQRLIVQLQQTAGNAAVNGLLRQYELQQGTAPSPRPVPTLQRTDTPTGTSTDKPTELSPVSVEMSEQDQQLGAMFNAAVVQPVDAGFDALNPPKPDPKAAIDKFQGAQTVVANLHPGYRARGKDVAAEGLAALNAGLWDCIDQLKPYTGHPATIEDVHGQRKGIDVRMDRTLDDILSGH